MTAMNGEAIEYLHSLSIGALDDVYKDLLRLARQGAPEAKDQLRAVAELRARLSHDQLTLEAMLRDIDALPY